LIPLLCPKRQKQQQKKCESGSDILRTREDNKNSEYDHHKKTYLDESRGEQNRYMIRIEFDDLSKSPVVIGRQQLLTSFCAACNIDLTKANRQTSPRFETCRWAAKALSREMLRFSDAGMQIRGNHAVVFINGKMILSTGEETDDHSTGKINNHSIQNNNAKTSQKNEWSVNPVIIVPGDVLSFEPRGGQGLCSRLEFNVASLEHEKVSTITKKNGVGNRSTNGSIMDKGKLEKNDRGAQEKYETCIDYSSREVVLGDICKTLKVNETNNSRQSNSTNLAKSSFLVHFFPFGNDVGSLILQS